MKSIYKYGGQGQKSSVSMSTFQFKKTAKHNQNKKVLRNRSKECLGLCLEFVCKFLGKMYCIPTIATMEKQHGNRGPNYHCTKCSSKQEQNLILIF